MKNGSYYKTHNEVVKTTIDILNNLSEGYIKVFRRNNGQNIRNNKFVKSNETGMADIWGFVKSNLMTIPIEIEIKTGKNKSLSESQKRWKKICDEMEVCHVVASSYKDVILGLDKFTNAIQDKLVSEGEEQINENSKNNKNNKMH